MKRTIKKQIWLNREEAQQLQKKSKKACLTEAALIRQLLSGYEPREAPGDEFYKFNRELSHIGNNLNQIAIKANSSGQVSTQDLDTELRRLHEDMEGQDQSCEGDRLCDGFKENCSEIGYWECDRVCVG